MDFLSLLQILDSTVRLSTPLLLAALAGLYSERSGAVLRIPDGTLLPANGTLLVSGSDGNGDIRFSGEDKPLDKKKKNTVVLYSALGAQLDSLHQ